jgi:arylsulfatase A
MKLTGVIAALTAMTLVVSASATSCGPGGSGAPGRPNVIIILADDLGWGDLGVYGADKVDTPNCDRLASEGIRFTDAHSTSAVCSPSRYSVLTGRYGWRTWLKNGILLEHMPLLIESGRLTLPEMMRRSGYATACIGKWHLGWGNDIGPDWNGEVAPGPLETGFDYFFGIPFSHNSSPLQRVYVKNRSVHGLREGESIGDMKTFPRIRRRLDTTAERLTSAAVNWIGRNSAGPFFLYFPTTNVHMPWTPGRQFLGSSRISLYGDFIVEFDWIVGQILEAVDSAGIADRTLIIVTSDNGANKLSNMMSHQPNGRWRGRKGDIFEAGHRIPFIAKWPGRIAPGVKNTDTISLVDLMATCAAIVGYELPDSSAEDSFDLLPLLEGDSLDGPVRESTIFHSVTGMFAIREGKWKLIDGQGNGNVPVPEVWSVVREEARFVPRRDPETGRFRDVWYDFRVDEPSPDEPPGQLYDLENDPGETVNLWADHPEVVGRLLALLESYRRP